MEETTRTYPPSEEFAAQAVAGAGLYDEAAEDRLAYWARRARQHLHWEQDFTEVLDWSDAPFAKWFPDGTTNAAYNALDRHVEAGNGDRVALHFEGEPGDTRTWTYAELAAEVRRAANAFESLGVTKGDRVAVYLPMIPEAVITMLACARIGAVHSVVFGGFSADALRSRVDDAEAKLVVTADGSFRRGKPSMLKPAVDQALAAEGHTVQHVLVVKRNEADVEWTEGRDLWWHETVPAQSDEHELVWHEAEHPLFILYTSGSTGKPKGVQHSTGGYMLWARQTVNWTFDMKDSDVFWCTADIGWITGHTYVAYGPLSAGATQIVFEGVPTFPNAGRFWQMIERHGCTVFYTAPTAIRSLIKAADSDEKVHPKNWNLSSLRILGSVGEPINPEAWMWYYKHIGGERCPIVDTFWQTENGGHMITPLPGATPLVPGSCTLPLPGITAAIVDESGNDMPHGAGGILVVKKPWPSMIRNIWGDPERFKKSYFPEELKGYYLAGDGAVRSEDRGYFRITGRIDDVLNVSGHRMGTMEIESALVSKTDLVAEAAVVGRPDDLTGEAICAFVVLKRPVPTGEEAKALANELRNWVAKEIGPIAKPKDIRFGENLPKTRSGKIMRRLLRSIAKGEAITQDTSTLENPAILEQLAKTN